jgi:basic membrane lipoprotein Med (substrate-binding protein (PBP1-ABC) superfamily)
MNRTTRTRVAVSTAIATAALAGSAVAATLGHTADRRSSDTGSKAIVIAGQAADDAQLVERARRINPDLRVVHTNAEQLGVTVMLAARGYDEVVTVGVDRRTAIAPVQRRYPDTRFVVAETGDFGRE